MPTRNEALAQFANLAATPGASGNLVTSNGTALASSPGLTGQTDSASPFETSLGALAGQSNTGTRNTFVGYASGASNTSGADVCAIGTQALNANTTGSENTAVGSNALTSNTTGVRNCAVGYQSLGSNSASNNTAVGSFSLTANTTGTNNTATGYLALSYCQTGSQNSAFGNLCLLYATSNNNSAFGNFALASLTTGNNNTSLGYYAGYDVISGSNNTCLGSSAQPSSGSVSNEITLGNSSVSTLRCATTTITSLSDARDKKNIVDLAAGLAFVNGLRPVAFDWATRDEAKVDIPDTGFLAQDLQQVQAQLGVTIPGLVYDSNPEKLEAGYSKLLPVLVKAIQELSAEVQALKAQIA